MLVDLSVVIGTEVLSPSMNFIIASFGDGGVLIVGRIGRYETLDLLKSFGIPNRWDKVETIMGRDVKLHTKSGQFYFFGRSSAILLGDDAGVLFSPTVRTQYVQFTESGHKSSDKNKREIESKMRHDKNGFFVEQ